jgi:FkbM family methyltransferase
MDKIRSLFLKILKATAINTTITHHFTHKKFLINTYHHKGYWYFGKKREENTIQIFQKWIKKGDYVLEIGGHIGYFTTLYSILVRETGKIDVFEPSELNLFYLKKNIGFLPKKTEQIITVENAGAGDINGTFDFYIDPISGQNNSFIKNFDGFLSSRKLSAETSSEMIVTQAKVITLDSYYEKALRLPDFVKIDVEGYEWNVLQGFKNTIAKHRPKLMVEIQNEAQNILTFFKKYDYTIYNDKLEEIIDYNDYLKKRTPNIFFQYYH